MFERHSPSTTTSDTCPARRTNAWIGWPEHENFTTYPWYLHHISMMVGGWATTPLKHVWVRDFCDDDSTEWQNTTCSKPPNRKIVIWADRWVVPVQSLISCHLVKFLIHDWGRMNSESSGHLGSLDIGYPLANCHVTMGNITMFNGKTQYKWPCSIAV